MNATSNSSIFASSFVSGPGGSLPSGTSGSGLATSVRMTPPPSRVTELHYNFCSANEVLQHSVLPCQKSQSVHGTGSQVSANGGNSTNAKPNARSDAAGAAAQQSSWFYCLRDTRLGVCNRTDTCATCGEKLEKCVGHAGHITLALPVFHPGLFNTMLRVLRCICKTCSNVLLPDTLKGLWDKKVRQAQLSGDIYRVQALVKEITTEAAKQRSCDRCGAVNGIVRNVRPFRVVHFKYDGINAPAAANGIRAPSASAAARKKAAAAAGKGGADGNDDGAHGFTDVAASAVLGTTSQTADSIYRTTLGTATLLNETIPTTRAQLVDFLDPVRVRTLLANVRPGDVTLFGMEPGVSLRDLVTTTVPITPMCTRPSGVMQGSGPDLRDDDVTRLYFEVASSNEALKSAIAAQGNSSTSVVHWWSDLQFRFVRLLDAGLPGYLPAQRSMAPVKGFAQRLKGKHGRFRGNLSGKRVDFSGRSVISPDPNLEIDEVAIPLRMAKSLTYPQKVFAHNLSLMKKFVQNGPDTHPGALTVILQEDGTRKDLRFHDRIAVAQRLQIGDIVERHCISGDFVIFNRQPSLHRLSMMSHRARVLPHRTLRFNECCCAPYNADFDGDEMNIHLVQTEDARAEAHTLMSTVRNIITAKNGEPIIACTQDFLTGSFLLSSMDTFLDRAQFSQLVAYWGNASGLPRDMEDFDLPPPTILKPLELWTGKQVFDLMICPRFDTRKQNSVTPCKKIEMNLEAAGGQYTKGARALCRNEAWVTFHRGHLITGRLDKKLLGGGAKDGLFAQLNVVTGTALAAHVMGRIARSTSRWLQNRGFSLGLGDVATSRAVHERKQQVVEAAFADCRALIRDAAAGRMQNIPGMSVAQTLESKLNGILSKVREVCGTEAVKVLDKSNAPLVMAQSGSKGSTLNIAQMMACVGQQTVNGSRIKPSFFHRTLPHVPRYAEDPAARGFVVSSFFNGLTPTEFFFHTMAGREGLVDTAVKTADTGYIQRRVMKACEDLSVQYDGTVRTAKKSIVQFRFGEDGLDPLVMEGGNNSPVNFSAMWKNLLNAAEAEMVGFPASDASKKNNNTNSATGHLGESAQDLLALVKSLVAEHGQKKNADFTGKFSDEILAFATGLVQRHVSMRERLGVDGPGVPPTERVKRFVCCLNLAPCSAALLREFLARCARKYITKRQEPGSPCGALAAQSLCEPATQMTLRTFHFAGVASMSVTMGVPRLKEIINASKSIKTPIVTAPLTSAVHDKGGSALARAAVERVTLRDITARVQQVISPGKVYLRFTLHRGLIGKMQIALNSHTVKQRIFETGRKPLSPLRALQDRHIEIEDSDNFIVRPYREESGDVFFTLQSLRAVLLDVHVYGIESAKNVMVVEDEPKGGAPKPAKPTYTLLAETPEFMRIMTLPFVDGTRTTCNHIDSVFQALGIEAARTLIVEEIKCVLSAYSMAVDVRHIQLIADVMTQRGVVLGIQNYGIQKMNSGVLTMASFERTTDHLYNACVMQRSDKSLSVSESIIVGAPIPLGTNSFGLLLRYEGGQSKTTTTAAAADDAAVWEKDTSPASAPKQQLSSSSSVTGPIVPPLMSCSGSRSKLSCTAAASASSSPSWAFRSIFERSPLTASMNVTSSISFASDIVTSSKGSKNNRAEPQPSFAAVSSVASPRRRLYSMERAKSGSHGVDMNG